LREAAKEARSLQALASAGGRELAAYLRDATRADKLNDKVNRDNEVAKAAFLRDHIDERGACKQLFTGDDHLRAKPKLRDMVRRGLLTEVPSPKAREVEGVWEAAREIESFWPLAAGGPFFAKAELLERCEECRHLAREVCVPPPPPPALPLSTLSDEEVRDFLTILLVIAASHDRRESPPPGP
jgi:hypothetical protein